MSGSDQPFPPGFFGRADTTSDRMFYQPSRLVTHIDDDAIAAVGELYDELGLTGRLLDLMSSWISHLPGRPEHLTVLGMNAVELDANPMADDRVVHDLNADPTLPFEDGSFDHAMCAVSVDYLTRPVEVFDEVARVVATGGRFVCTFSNRCFPTKVIGGWLATPERDRPRIVAEYFRHSTGWSDPIIDVRIPPGFGTDPLYAVHATRT